MSEVRKIIRVSVDDEVTEHEFPAGTRREQLTVLLGLIGNGCDMVENVNPMRLYTDLGFSNDIDSGKAVGMLVDEEGLYREKVQVNEIGSYLYEMNKHGYPIVGNVLFIGYCWEDGGIDFCGIEPETFEKLHSQIKNLAIVMEHAKEAFG